MNKREEEKSLFFQNYSFKQDKKELYDKLQKKDATLAEYSASLKEGHCINQDSYEENK